MSNVQPIHPNDSWIVDESNRVVGVQTKNTAATFGNVTATTNPLTGGVELSKYVDTKTAPGSRFVLLGDSILAAEKASAAREAPSTLMP